MRKHKKNEVEKDQNKRNMNKKYLIIFMRWLFLASIPAYFILGPEKNVGSFTFLETLAITLIYNILVTLYIIKNNKNRYVSYVAVFIDALVISVFTYQLGGINSEAYLLFLFLIGYCGIFNEASKTLKIGLFCIISYSFFCIYASKHGLGEFNYWRLVIKDVFIAFAAYGMALVNSEVQRYNEMHRKEFKLARTDKLTGLANRHYFEQKLNDEVLYADTTNSPLNILIFDLDNFKKFNDTYGHINGDKLLSLFADIIKQNIRKTDIPVRYGGEEFMILIRELDIENAKTVGDRIRRQLEKQRIFIGSDENKKRVTVSCGVAQYPKHSCDIREVIECADKALYHAKEIGKNIAVAYDEIGAVNHQLDLTGIQ